MVGETAVRLPRQGSLQPPGRAIQPGVKKRGLELSQRVLRLAPDLPELAYAGLVSTSSSPPQEADNSAQAGTWSLLRPRAAVIGALVGGVIWAG
jgi:hypothetical protein